MRSGAGLNIFGPANSVAARIFSADGALDLGEQTTTVLAAA